MRFFFLLLLPITLIAECPPALQAGIEAFRSQQISLAEMSPEQVAALADSWQGKLMVLAKVEGPLRQVDPKVVRALAEGGQLRLVMRHGEQQMSQRVQWMRSSAEQKIAMMREAQNRANPITERSAVELMSTLIVMRYVQERTGQAFAIESSVNERAMQAAEAMALMLDTEVVRQEVWDCVNYPDEEFMPTDFLVQELPSGKLPWTAEKVDLVLGAGTFQSITNGVAQQLMQESAEHVVSLTHTQQLNALAELARLPVERLSTFGFALVPGGAPKETQIFQAGVYK